MSGGFLEIERRVLQKGRIQIAIEDNGRGIPKRQLPKLFKKGASFGNVNGIGLGLFSSKQITERWGGNVKIRSRERFGTKVTITLPAIENGK